MGLVQVHSYCEFMSVRVMSPLEHSILQHCPAFSGSSMLLPLFLQCSLRLAGGVSIDVPFRAGSLSFSTVTS